MKTLFPLFASLTLALTTAPVFGATIIVSDNFTASNVGSGFVLGEGFNSGINGGTSTRLTGTAAANLHYLRRGNKNATAYSISNNRGNITQGSQSGRFTISEDGANPYDFAPLLGSLTATPENPVIYDVAISMDNNVSTNDTTVGRMTFAFGTVEAGGGFWSIGVQIIPTVNGNYNIYRRIKTGASGLSAELNSVVTNAGANASEVTFLLRITDAGTEIEPPFNSRVQISLNGGTTWFYDTQSDTNLTNGWCFEAATRFVSFDQAPNGGADVYDNFSISFPDPLIWTGNGFDDGWSTGNNWLKGVPPVTGPTIVTGDALVFSGTTQQTNFNDISDLSVSSVTFSNGGFSLSGNPFTITSSITNITGDNAVNNDVFLGANARFHSTANTLAFNGSINSTGRNLTVSGNGQTIINGAINTDTGTLTKQTAAGTLTLNGTNTYTGTTTVSAGLLNVNGLIFSSSTVVAAAGTLGGTGTVNGPVTVNGSLSAGNSIGKLTTGTLTLNSNGTNVFEISSVTGTAGVDWDLVDAEANAIDVQATSAPFKFRMVASDLNNFNKDTTYSWLAIGGIVQNFSAEMFSVIDSGFTNDLAGGAFSVEPAGNGLTIQYVNNQAPTAGPTNFTFAAGTPFQVSIAGLLADRTSDPDGDARVLVSVTSTNAEVSTNATDITITSGGSSTESIAYVVRDARNYKAGDTVRMATNYINIVVTNAPGGGVLTISNNGGQANINFVGNPNQSYVIQRSQTLTSWTDIATNTAAGDGSVQFNEVPPHNPAFYRTREE